MACQGHLAGLCERLLRPCVRALQTRLPAAGIVFLLSNTLLIWRIPHAGVMVGVTDKQHPTTWKSNTVAWEVYVLAEPQPPRSCCCSYSRWGDAQCPSCLASHNSAAHADQTAYQLLVCTMLNHSSLRPTGCASRTCRQRGINALPLSPVPGVMPHVCRHHARHVRTIRNALPLKQVPSFPALSNATQLDNR